MATMGRCVKIDDPRDSLQKARRLELVRFANDNGLKDITEMMDADTIRDRLRARGLTNIRVPPRPIGMEGRTVIASKPPARVAANGGGDTVTLSQTELGDIIKDAVASALLQNNSPPARAKPPRFKRLVERPRSEINQLRDECKRLGIHMDRRDRMPDLKRKIAEHGQNASE